MSDTYTVNTGIYTGYTNTATTVTISSNTCGTSDSMTIPIIGRIIEYLITLQTDNILIENTTTGEKTVTSGIDAFNLFCRYRDAGDKVNLVKLDKDAAKVLFNK